MGYFLLLGGSRRIIAIDPPPQPVNRPWGCGCSGRVKGVLMADRLGGPPRAHATTIIAVRRNGQVAMAGDGQVTIGDVVLKHTARKLRPLYQDRVLAGFAGAVEP